MKKNVALITIVTSVAALVCALTFKSKSDVLITKAEPRSHEVNIVASNSTISNEAYDSDWYSYPVNLTCSEAFIDQGGNPQPISSLSGVDKSYFTCDQSLSVTFDGSYLLSFTCPTDNSKYEFLAFTFQLKNALLDEDASFIGFQVVGGDYVKEYTFSSNGGEGDYITYYGYVSFHGGYAGKTIHVDKIRLSFDCW